MRPRHILLAVLVLAATPALASDHADPMSLNVLATQDAPEANITDMHAFVVDRNGLRIREGDPVERGDQLILSLCVRRALRPDQIAALDLKGYKFRVHLDLAPPVRIFDEATIRPAKTPAEELAQHQRDRSMQALYGGIITHPTDIGATALLELELGLVQNGESSQAVVTGRRVEGISGQINVVTEGQPLLPGAINIQAGVFDDPFIFPRFFRRNVVGIVTSIPLANLNLPDGPGPILIWATTHQGNKQIDHVGRSLRTQLPRFGYLNDKPPAQHVAAITRVHDRPSLMEAAFATVIAPLFAHRHYDSVPDVMIYDLRRPARFPNGRALDDDVSKILADAGETLLFELSYAESRQFPRATKNDKPFSPAFPYLAPRWTSAEIAAHAQPGTMMGGFEVPWPPDSAAIAPLNFDNHIWRTLWWGALLAIVALATLLCFAVRSNVTRGIVALAAVVVLCLLGAVRAPNMPGAAEQPSTKLMRVGIGGAFAGALFLSLVFAWGRRAGAKRRVEGEPMPQGCQAIVREDRQYRGSRFSEIRSAVMDEPYYKVWSATNEKPLPIYKQSLAILLRGLWRFWGSYPFLQAARRTVKSDADLRWGHDGRGVRRLLHPMGICLAGTWKIDSTPTKNAYTGCFKPGSEGLLLVRYSTGGSNPFGGRTRTLAMVGKLFPTTDRNHPEPLRPASFITQEDIGGSLTGSIREAELRNSADVTPLRRGLGLPGFLLTAAVLLRADKQPAERQLYEIAELGKTGGPTVCPRFMRLKIESDRPPAGEGMDFRDEILELMYERGDPRLKCPLVFGIEVSDQGERTGTLVQRVQVANWTRIGSMTFTEAAASYNGDFVIHFHHPPWREDRNDPKTIARRDLRTP